MEKTIKFVWLILIFLCGCKDDKKMQQPENYEAYVNEIINSFATEMQEEFGLICNGSGGKMPYSVEEISIGFIAYQPSTIAEARRLEVTLTEKFLEKINAHEKIRPFLKEYPFKTDRAEVEISFRKSDSIPYTDGSITYVFQVDNKICYCIRNEQDAKITLLQEEPYDEALKIVNESYRR